MNYMVNPGILLEDNYEHELAKTPQFSTCNCRDLRPARRLNAFN